MVQGGIFNSITTLAPLIPIFDSNHYFFFNFFFFQHLWKLWCSFLSFIFSTNINTTPPNFPCTIITHLTSGHDFPMQLPILWNFDQGIFGLPHTIVILEIWYGVWTVTPYYCDFVLCSSISTRLLSYFYSICWWLETMHWFLCSCSCKFSNYFALISHLDVTCSCHFWSNLRMNIVYSCRFS